MGKKFKITSSLRILDIAHVDIGKKMKENKYKWLGLSLQRTGYTLLEKLRDIPVLS